MSGFLSGLIPLEADSGGFEAPGVHSFDVPPLFENVPWLYWFDKYMLQAGVSVILILAFWLIMARKSAMVPSKGQYLGETAYFFLRNSIARDMIGHDFRRYLPLLIALFSFVLINNLFGVFPLSLLPTPSHIGWPYGLALLVWVIYNGVGIAKHGFFGYLKHATLPSGVPAFMWPLIILTSDDRYTMPVAVATLLGEHVLDFELMMASAVLTVVPVLTLFFILQKQYIAGMMAGSVKG